MGQNLLHSARSNTARLCFTLHTKIVEAKVIQAKCRRDCPIKSRDQQLTNQSTVNSTDTHVTKATLTTHSNSPDSYRYVMTTSSV